MNPTAISQNLKTSLKTREKKPVVLFVVYKFKRTIQCETGYFGFTTRHLYQRNEKHKKTLVGKQVMEKHGLGIDSISKNFTVLRKYLNKFYCLIHEMLFIKQLKPILNGQLS